MLDCVAVRDSSPLWVIVSLVRYWWTTSLLRLSRNDTLNEFTASNESSFTLKLAVWLLIDDTLSKQSLDT